MREYLHTTGDSEMDIYSKNGQVSITLENREEIENFGWMLLCILDNSLDKTEREMAQIIFDILEEKHLTN